MIKIIVGTILSLFYCCLAFVILYVIKSENSENMNHEKGEKDEEKNH